MRMRLTGVAVGVHALMLAGPASDLSAQGIERSGRVLDVATGEPIAQAVVTLVAPGVSAVSDRNGYFVLVAPARGAYSLRADRVGYEATDGTTRFPNEQELRILMTPAAVEDPNAPGRIEGRVSDDDGDWLRNVEVGVAGENYARGLTNGQGRFSIVMPPGTFDVQLTLLGFEQRTVSLVVQPGRTTEVLAELSTQPVELAPIDVVIRSTFLERNGFYQRQRVGRGEFWTRADIEERGPREVTDLLPGSGIRVPEASYGLGRVGPPVAAWHDQTLSSLTAPEFGCSFLVFVDGAIMFGADVADIDMIPVERVEAIEAYNGREQPLWFTIGGQTCGAIVIWTKRLP